MEGGRKEQITMSKEDFFWLWESHISAFASLSEAEGCDSSWLGDKVKSPLAGLSVGVKDVIDVAGLPTRNGSAACYNAANATHDAPVVARLRTQGVHIVGKTTTTEFAFTDPTDCRNPYDINRTPGGSSSGSGAAVAAGLVDIALGTQTAGSLCRPAAYCGVVGFKPSYGVLPTQGVTPLAPSFDTIGIIARTVGQARAAFFVMADKSPPVAMASHGTETIIQALFDTAVAPSAEALTALHNAGQEFGDARVTVAQSPLVADVARIVLAHRLVMNFEAAEAHKALMVDGLIEKLQPNFLKGLRFGAATGRDEVETARAYLSEAKKAFWAELEGIDAVLTLPVPDGAPLIDGTTGFQDWLTPWTVFGGPLICVPWGLDDLQRPCSVMLAARPGQDAVLLDMAEALIHRAPMMGPPKLP